MAALFGEFLLPLFSDKLLRIFPLFKSSTSWHLQGKLLSRKRLKLLTGVLSIFMNTIKLAIKSGDDVPRETINFN